MEELRKEALHNGNKVRDESRLMGAFHSAIEHIYERQSVAQKHEIFAESLNRGLGHVTLRDLGSIEDHLVDLRDAGGLNARFTTRDNLEREKWSVDHVNRSQGKRSSLLPGYQSGAQLSQEQREAVTFVGESRD